MKGFTRYFIKQYFIKEDRDLLIDIMEKTGRTELCWYPSSGIDLSHIKEIELEALQSKRPDKPLLYVHTDIIMRKKEDFANSPYETIDPNIKIVKMTELRPRRLLKKISSICHFGPDENTGRVFLLEANIETVYNKREITIHNIPILYFIVENLSFFINVLLYHGLEVHTLVHHCDGGGSLGGSRMPMFFIYYFAHTIKLKRALSSYIRRQSCSYISGEPFYFFMLMLEHTIETIEPYKNTYEYKCQRRLNAIQSNISHIRKQDIWSIWYEKGKIGKFPDWHLISDNTMKDGSHSMPDYISQSHRVKDRAYIHEY